MLAYIAALSVIISMEKREFSGAAKTAEIETHPSAFDSESKKMSSNASDKE
jgi:hypothetical protein